MARAESLEAQLAGPDLPAPIAYVLEWFDEVGPCLSSGMGPVPLTFAEIGAWADLRRIALAPWEAQALRLLSEVFCEVSAAG